MKSEIRTMYDLMQAVAHKLAGEDVILRMHGCAYEKYDGISYKSESGAIVIDMRSGLDDSLSLRTFLHELSHCVLHVRIMPRVNIASLKPNSIKEPVNLTEKVMREEDEANELARKWLAWARAYINVFPDRFSGMSDEEAILQALLNYKK
jgi:hypothetical protein